MASTISPPTRFAPATSISFGLHAALAALLVMAAGTDAIRTRDQVPLSDTPERIVWLPRTGGAGLRGGGGNNDRRPVQRAQSPGADAMTVATRTPPQFDARTIKPETAPPAAIEIPALPQAKGLEVLPGIFSAEITAPTDSMGPGGRTGAGSGKRGGTGDRDGTQFGNDPGGGGPGVNPPQLVSQVRPTYTADALHARLQGIVGLEVVVLPDGSVGDVRVTRSLDRQAGLDAEAIKAVKQWKFRPGTRNGRPIPVVVSIELTFTLR